MNKRRTILLSGVFLLGVALILQACAGPDPKASPQATAAPSGGQAAKPSGAPYKIGLACDLTSGFAGSNGPQVHAWQSYFAHVNANGGINGRPVEVIVADVQSSTDVSRETALVKKMVELDQVLGYDSCWSTAVTANLDYFNSKKVPVLSLGSLREWFAPGKDYSYIFSAQPAYEETVQVAVGYLAKASQNAGGGKRIAGVYLDNVAGRGIADTAKALAGKDGLQVVAEEFAPATQVDYSSTALKLKQANPDMLLTALSSAQLAPFAEAMKAQGWSKPWVGYFATADNDLQKGAGTYAAIRLWATGSEAVVDPDVKTMVDISTKYPFVTETDPPSSWFASGWIRARIWENALKQCKDPCTPTAVRDALEKTNMDFGGIAGKATAAPDKHWMLSTVRVYAWDSDKKMGTPLGDWLDVTKFAGYTGKTVGK